MIESLAPYAKAVVPLIVSVLLTVTGAVGVTPEMTMEQALTLLVTTILVYIVPNKKTDGSV